MGDKYLGIREDLRSKDIRIYEDIIDNIYETIDDPLEPVHGGNYIHIVDHWNHSKMFLISCFQFQDQFHHFKSTTSKIL